jgi:hypothetical protein
MIDGVVVRLVVVVGGVEVTVDVVCLVFLDTRFSDRSSNLLRFAGLFLSR